MNALEVTATYHGGYAATVHARGHTIAVDEPQEIGGEDAGAMPTELLCAALASCFALALGHVARSHELELGDLTVHVRAERAGRERRYGRMVLTAVAALPELAALVERAERLCWVSNTFATPPEIEYRTATEVP